MNATHRPSRRFWMLLALAGACATVWLDATNGQPRMAASVPTSAAATQAASPLAEMARDYRRKARQAVALSEAAAASKTAGQADRAASLEAQAAAARQQAESALATIRMQFSRLLKDIDNDSYKVREEASAALENVISQDPWLLTQARQAAVGSSLEVVSRLDEIATKVGDFTLDDKGQIRQWAVDANASSQYGDPDWSAKQATGKPNTFAAEDLATAWASLEPDGGVEWLELTYRMPVRPTLVRVRESFNPGAVVKLEGQDPNGTWHELWKGKDTTTECPGWLDIAVTKPAWPCRVIRITLDTASVKGWNEIDAVELIGELDEDSPATQPATQPATRPATSPAKPSEPVRRIPDRL